MKTNYKVIYIDYVQNDINETNELVNESLDIYSTFSKAKKKLLKYLNNEKNQIHERILEIKKLNKQYATNNPTNRKNQS
jgi:hypothetical protein